MLVVFTPMVFFNVVAVAIIYYLLVFFVISFLAATPADSISIYLNNIFLWIKSEQREK